MVIPTLSRMAGLEAIIPVNIRLAGLGDTCVDWNEDGTCANSIPDASSSTTITNTGGFFGTFTPPSGADSNPIYTPANQPTNPSSPSVTQVYQTQYGEVVTVMSDGTWRGTSPDGTGATVYGTGTPPAAASSPPPITAAQANVWGTLINSLASAGVRIGTVAMLKPGQTLLPNGTILGSGQAIVSPYGNVNSSFASILTSPMFLVGVGAILLLAIAEGGR